MSDSVLVRDMREGNEYLINGKTAILTGIAQLGDEGGLHHGHNPTYTLQFTMSNSWDDKYVSVPNKKNKFSIFHN